MQSRDDYLRNLVLPDDTTKLLDLKTYPISEKIYEDNYNTRIKCAFNKFLENGFAPIVLRKHLFA